MDSTPFDSHQADRALVARLAALLRIAKVLDVGRKQVVSHIRCRVSGRRRG